MADQAQSSSLAVLKTLRIIREIGAKPVPLVHGSKKPLENKWTDPEYQADPAMWERQQLNIGMLTGPSRGGPVDIDVDCQEGVVFAAAMLPKTSMIFGRKSKPKSHYLYKVETDELSRKAYYDFYDGGVIMEVRGDGGQTMCPGSIHDSGELVEWASDADSFVPATADAEVLTHTVKKITAAINIVRHVWVEGQRHEAVLRLAGIFCWYGWELDETLEFLRVIEDYDGERDPTHKKTITQTYAKHAEGKPVMGGPSMTQFLGDDGKFVDGMNALFSSAALSVVEEYNEKYACSSAGGLFKIVNINEDLCRKNRGYLKMTRADWLHSVEPDVITMEDEKGVMKKIPKGKVWLSHQKRKEFTDIRFLPNANPDTLESTLNEWVGWGDGKEDVPATGFSLWDQHTKEVVCDGNPDLYEWLMDWLADIVQDPTTKSGTCFVMQGGFGKGKDSFASYIGRAIGEHYFMEVTQPEQVTGKFNNWMSSVMLVFANEAIFAKGHKHMPILKSLITDERQAYEEKFGAVRQGASYCRVMMASNELHVIRKEIGDRRFTVANVDKTMSKDFWNSYYREYNNGGPRALLAHLLKRKYDKATIRRPFMTKAGEAQVLESLRTIPMWWLNCLITGYIPLREDRHLQDVPYREWATCISKAGLEDSYVNWCKAEGESPEQNFHQKFYNMANRKKISLGRKRFEAEGPYINVIRLPNIKTNRAEFEAYVGHNIDWDAATENEDYTEAAPTEPQI